jgi:hypothetical protein
MSLAMWHADSRIRNAHGQLEHPQLGEDRSEDQERDITHLGEVDPSPQRVSLADKRYNARVNLGDHLKAATEFERIVRL